jgi:hypothetical protein
MHRHSGKQNKPARLVGEVSIPNGVLLLELSGRRMRTDFFYTSYVHLVGFWKFSTGLSPIPSQDILSKQFT